MPIIRVIIATATLAISAGVAAKKIIDNNTYGKDGFNKAGYDKHGYDRKGYNKQGYDQTGYNEKGFNKLGFDKFGYNKDGFDKDGYNKDGYNQNGYDKDGYDRDGYDKDGYNKEKFKRNGKDISDIPKDDYRIIYEEMCKRQIGALNNLRNNNLEYALYDVRKILEESLKRIIYHFLGVNYVKDGILENLKICEHYSLLDSDSINKLHSVRKICNKNNHEINLQEEITYNQAHFAVMQVKDLLNIFQQKLFL